MTSIVVFSRVAILLLLLVSVYSDPPESTACCICGEDKSIGPLANTAVKNHACADAAHRACVEEHLVRNKCKTCPVCREEFDANSELIQKYQANVEAREEKGLPQLFIRIYKLAEDLERIPTAKFNRAREQFYTEVAIARNYKPLRQKIEDRLLKTLDKSVTPSKFSSIENFRQRMWLLLLHRHPLPEIEWLEDEIQNTIVNHILQKPISDRIGAYTAIQKQLLDVNPFVLYLRKKKSDLKSLLYETAREEISVQAHWNKYHLPQYKRDSPLKDQALKISNRFLEDAKSKKPLEDIVREWAHFFESQADIYCHVEAVFYDQVDFLIIYSDREIAANYYKRTKDCALWTNEADAEEAVEHLHATAIRTADFLQMDRKLYDAVMADKALRRKHFADTLKSKDWKQMSKHSILQLPRFPRETLTLMESLTKNFASIPASSLQL